MQGDCGGLTHQGCCDGELLKWCQDGLVAMIDCSQAPSCGWSAAGFYDCGTEGVPDPGGTYPIECPGCTPTCTDKECGADGCGGTCGECAGGQTCDDGECVSEELSCGDVTQVGCCEGTVLMWCSNGTLMALDCIQKPLCGWSEAGTYDCGTEGMPDPSGEYPMDCGMCQVSCDDRECGSDGCGGLCGTCGTDEVCVEGQCLVTTVEGGTDVASDAGSGPDVRAVGDIAPKDDAGDSVIASGAKSGGCGVAHASHPVPAAPLVSLLGLMLLLVVLRLRKACGGRGL